MANRFICILFSLMAGFSEIAFAQDYPTKPIKLVVPYPPGGGTDIIARIVQDKLSQALKQPVIIENRGGAGGAVGTEVVAKAAPDGYTILFTLSSHTINPFFGKLSYDPQSDFASIGVVASLPQIIVTQPTSRLNTLRDVVAAATAKPGSLNYASVGNGTPSHIAGELLKARAGVSWVHIPYKGGGPALTDTLGGQVEVMIVSIPVAMPHVRSGKLKALGVTTLKRTPAAPEVPTVAEALGLPDYEVDSWYAMFAPAKTPPAIINRLQAEMAKVVQLPEIKEKLLAQGADAVGGKPEQLDKIVIDELKKWAELAKSAGFKAD